MSSGTSRRAGIDSSSTGDVVLVGPGTYREQIDFKGKNITVRGEMGASTTILDGTGLGTYGVRFENGETRAAALEGLTITHHKRGIIIFQSQPSILRNTITANGGMTLYAGVICTANGEPGPWSPLIQGNTVTNNTAGWTGPGIAAFKKMTPEILDNYIAGNQGLQKPEAFWELLKLIFCKIHDERDSPEVEFYAAGKERGGINGPLKVKARLEQLDLTMQGFAGAGLGGARRPAFLRDGLPGLATPFADLLLLQARHRNDPEVTPLRFSKPRPTVVQSAPMRG